MRKRVALLAFAVSFALAAAQTAAFALSAPSVGTQKVPEPANLSQPFKADPAGSAGKPGKDHKFPVNDAKGLLLTCIAPEIDSNPSTDIFTNCTLAPGRTLDDVMHTFIGAIHFIQNEQEKERAEWQKDHEGEPAEKPAQK
jgi:hypothetical protein